jgi:acyl-CoA synthetase (AMP-forming)/AMP-acid ligase II
MPHTVYEQFLEAASDGPSLPFLCYPSSETRGYLPSGAQFSYGQTLGIVDNLTRQYSNAGYTAGHRVALVTGNRPEHFWHLLALNRLAVSVVMLNPDYLPHEMAFGIGFAESALVLAAPTYIQRVKEAVAGLTPLPPVVDMMDRVGHFPAPAHRPNNRVAAAGDREALIIYTSGTTGRPKGCVISNSSCLAAGESYTTAGGLLSFEQRRERLYIPLPAFHMNVSVYTLNSITRVQGCIIMQDRFSVSRWWRDLAETKATCFHYLGIIPPLLIKAPYSDDEKRHCAKFGSGAGVDPLVRQAFETRFGVPLIEAWGMTETSRAIQNSELPRCLEPRAFGRPRPPLEVLIADEHGSSLPHGTPGELLVRASGPNPRAGFFSGYLNLPDETELAWQGGWFHTGDIVWQRSDGMLFFVDRRKNIVRRSGENISAAEVEEALLVLPQVKSAAVLAVKDDLHDEEVLACIVPMPDVEPSARTADAILDGLEGKLAHHKFPAWLAFLDSMPVTGTQKIQKRRIFAEGQDPRTDPRTFDLRDNKHRRRADLRSGAKQEGVRTDANRADRLSGRA